MRDKKALKQLNKAEALISTVANRCTPSDSHLRELLESTTATIGQAKSVLDSRSARPDRASTQETKKQTQSQGPETAASAEFTGNKTDFVRAVVVARGTSGATPRDIDEAFTSRRIDRSKNLIYNSLSALVKQKKLRKQGDRYFLASMNTNAESVLPKKRISPEGLKRIIEANKRRWAQQKAPQRAQATTEQQKSNVGKKSAVARKATVKKVSGKRTAAKARA